MWVKARRSDRTVSNWEKRVECRADLLGVRSLGAASLDAALHGDSKGQLLQQRDMVRSVGWESLWVSGAEERMVRLRV